MLAAVGIIAVGCADVQKAKVDSRIECIYVSERFGHNKKLPPSEDFKKELTSKYYGWYKVVQDEIWMYAENSRLEFVYAIYGLSGRLVGYRDKNGTELTIGDLERLGPLTDAYDRTAERLPIFKSEREQFLAVQQMEKKVVGSTPYIATGKPNYCNI